MLLKRKRFSSLGFYRERGTLFFGLSQHKMLPPKSFANKRRLLEFECSMKVINLGTPLRAAEIIDELGKKRLAYADVRFQNVHLKKINDLIGRRVFTKNDLFMDAGGLWDILQEEDGTIGRYHHHHGLSPTFIISALSSLQDPELVILECQTHRYIVVTLSVDGKVVLAVIETDAPLRNNRNANINKLVTLYEKNDFPDYLRRIKKRTEARISYKK